MRLLHTADWHLGRQLGGSSLIEDQRHVLDQLVDIARDTRPDLVAVAGDVYDRAIPPREAVDLLDDVLSELVMGLGLRVVLIAGNHDSPERLEFAGGILARQGLHVLGHPAGQTGALRIDIPDTSVTVFALPYSEPVRMREVLGDADIRTHEDAMRAAGQRMAGDAEGRRKVLIGHAFVVGGITSDSESLLTVGGSEVVSARALAGFDYVALGHLHRPQNAAAEGRIRYSGSLLPYSVSEAGQDKSVSLVQIDESGEVAVEAITLQPKRTLRIVEGSFAELLQAEPSEDLVSVRLTDTEVVYDPVDRLRPRFPHILELRQAAFESVGPGRLASGDFRGRDDLELFAEFYEDARGGPMSDEQSKLVAAAMDELAAERRETGI